MPYQPQELPRIQVNLDRAGIGLQEVCNDAIKAAPAKKKGVIDEAVNAAVGPMIGAVKSAVCALWSRHVEQDKFEIETIEGQLEAAKWPEFEQAR